LLKQNQDLDNQNSDLLNQSSKQNELWGRRARDESFSSSSSTSPEGNTPPTPANGNGNGKPRGPLTLPSVAGEIFERHPKIRRDCSKAQVEKKLGAILKHKHIPVAQADEYLSRVNQNHAAACFSPTWQKDGGEFAKGLENWLAPTKERYESESAPAAPHKPRLTI
jgi:hypothetical protein